MAGTSHDTRPDAALAAVFSSALESFTNVSVAPAVQVDSQTSSISLSATRLRLSRWGMSVNIYGGASLQPLSLGVDTLRATVELGKIRDHLENAERVAGDQYPHLSLVRSTSYASSSEQALAEKIHEMCTRRQMGESNPLTAAKAWTIQSRDGLATLLGEVLASIRRIESLSSEAAALRGLQLAASDARQLSLGSFDPSGRIMQMIQVVDPQLVSACRSEGAGPRGGHTYRNIYIKGGVIINGDRFADHYVGGTADSGNTYDGMVIESAQVLNGNMYGGHAFMTGDRANHQGV